MTALAAAFAGLAGVLLARTYLRRRRRVRLRLLTGHRALFDEQLRAAGQQLVELEEGDLLTVGADTEDALNHLHAALLDRQAHLQNYEDLAHLQQRKIAALGYHLAVADPTEAAAPAPAEPDKPGEPGQRREQVQAELLEKIQRAQDSTGPSGAKGT